MIRNRLASLMAVLMTLTLAAGCSSGSSEPKAHGSGGGGPVPSASEPSSTVSPSPTHSPNPFDARVPKFPAAPPVEKVKLPDGPAAPFLHGVPTSQPVAFLTIDDGYEKKPEAIQLLQAAGIPVTLFLIGPIAAGNPDYFKQLKNSGAVIEDHTITHSDLKGRAYDFQKHEICQAADQLGHLFERRPLLFRPPYGDYDQNTLRAAKDCGMKAVVYWNETVDKGIVRYQTPEHKIKPGDVILMHFRPAYVDDFLAALNAIHAAGLTPALLEDYIL